VSRPCELCTRLAEIRAGTHPGLIAELLQTYAVLSDNQGCPGWCVLLLKEHREHLAELGVERQLGVFADVARVAAAMRAVFPRSGAGGGPPRINYGCLGNQVPHVHWHVVPRHADDPAPQEAVWGWPAERLRGKLDEGARREIVESLRGALQGS
jgi:diadenosine tetraphosphate (Ap4A) HIT family hydrolase